MSGTATPSYARSVLCGLVLGAFIVLVSIGVALSAPLPLLAFVLGWRTRARRGELAMVVALATAFSCGLWYAALALRQGPSGRQFPPLEPATPLPSLQMMSAGHIIVGALLLCAVAIRRRRE